MRFWRVLLIHDWLLWLWRWDWGSATAAGNRLPHAALKPFPGKFSPPRERFERLPRMGLHGNDDTKRGRNWNPVAYAAPSSQAEEYNHGDC
jgi:hypothetical protein